MRHVSLFKALMLALTLGLAMACSDGGDVSGAQASAAGGQDGSGTLAEDGEAGASGLDGSATARSDGASGQVGLDGIAHVDDGQSADVLADAAAVTADGGGSTLPSPDTSIAKDSFTGIPPGSKNDTPYCKTSQTQFDVLQKKALVCDSMFQCVKPGPEGLGCPCDRYYSNKTFDYQNLKDISGAGFKKGCQGKCLPEPCKPMAPLVGLCQAGSCIDYDATCDELDDMASLALTEALKCDSDAQCVFGANVDLKCGCSQYLNMQTTGPGKPLFEYMMMVVQAYNTKGCGIGVECACLSPLKATCKAGICVTQFKDAPG